MARSRGKRIVIHKGYGDFIKYSYDGVINCVGAGILKKGQGKYSDWFMLTEEFDRLAIDYLCRKRPEALYVNFSSGAVYGREFAAPVAKNSINPIRVNRIKIEDYYGIVRLNSEAKHRAFSNLRIVDLRLFSYFSRFMDLNCGYFIAGLLSCIMNKKVFITDSTNIIRDYVHPDDLFSMIIK